MKRNLLTFLFVLIQLNLLFAQQMKRCGTSEYMSRLKTEDPTLEDRLNQNELLLAKYIKDYAGQNRTSSVITIPVVFHVLWNISSQNISQNRINDQLATLNKDYARLNTDTGNTPSAFKSFATSANIQFCFAQRDPNGNPTTGVIRKQIFVSGFDPMTNDNIKYSSLGGDDAWPRSSYLNIWVAPFTGSSSQILGISQFPGGAAATDGCCVLYTTVGGNTYRGSEMYYNLGRTLTHEVAHWLNLKHVWGDDGGTCGGTDNVSDTPNQSDENYSCPSFPQTDGCTAASPGVMFMNYMDYVNDACMNMFTAGQSTRMNGSLNSQRPTIITSNGCTAIATGINDFVLKSSVSVYPNPTAGSITISGELNNYRDVTVTISNLLGAIIYSKEIKNTFAINLPVDLSKQAQGVYIVSLKTSDTVVFKKITLAY